jgi:pyridoxal phosphate-dependent aminotransferase EpsN
VPIVEEAAEALGATYRGVPAGNQGRLGIFSFNGNKIITTSGGGMLVCRDEAAATRARRLSTQARDPAPHYQHAEVGYNYRMSNLLAAVGRGQLRVLERRVAARRAIFDRYHRALGDLPGLEFMPEAGFGRATRWLTCAVITARLFGADREAVRLALEAIDVESRPLWKPMHLQPAFEGCPARGGQVSARLFEKGLCLPSGSSLSEVDQDRVIEVIRTVAAEGRRSA